MFANQLIPNSCSIISLCNHFTEKIDRLSILSVNNNSIEKQKENFTRYMGLGFSLPEKLHENTIRISKRPSRQHLRWLLEFPFQTSRAAALLSSTSPRTLKSSVRIS